MLSSMSTDALPRAERFAWFAELAGQLVMPSDISTEHSEEFRGAFDVLQLGAMQATNIAYTPVVSRRTASHIRRDDPELMNLALVVRGRVAFRQKREEHLFETGDMLLFDSSHSFESVSAGTAGEQDSECGLIILTFAGRELPAPRSRMEDLVGTRLPRTIPAAPMVAGFLRALMAGAGAWRPSDAPHLSLAATDMLALYLTQASGAADHGAAESGRRLMLRQVLGFIDEHLGDADLAPATIAAAHHISVRHLHALFQEQASTVSEWIRRCRLERAQRDLADPRLAHRPVAAVAARWGFRHPQDFSRAFRTMYGQTPSDFRHAALRNA